MTWICPKCERELKAENTWHNCVKTSIESLFAGKPDEILLVFDQLLSHIADWENVIISTTQNCIVFVHHQTFLVMRPMKTALDIKFYSETYQEHNSIVKSVAYSGKFENHFRISKVEEINSEIFKYLRNSYLLL